MRDQLLDPESIGVFDVVQYHTFYDSALQRAPLDVRGGDVIKESGFDIYIDVPGKKTANGQAIFTVKKTAMAISNAWVKAGLMAAKTEGEIEVDV